MSSTTETTTNKKYQLSLHADHLRRLWGVVGKPTPYAVVTLLGNEVQMGRTETRLATTNPDWCVPVKLELCEGHALPFRVCVYDWRENYQDALIAQADFEAWEVFQLPGHMQCKEDQSNNGAQ